MAQKSQVCEFKQFHGMTRTINFKNISQIYLTLLKPMTE